MSCKEIFGYLQSPNIASSRLSPMELNTSRVSSSLVKRPVTSTGNYYVMPVDRCVSPRLKRYSDPSVMLNYRDPKRQKIMCGKNEPEWKELNLKLEKSQSRETAKEIMMPSGKLLFQETSCKFLPTVEFCITGLCDKSQQTMLSLLRSLKRCMFSGARLVLESREEPGTKLEKVLIVKIQDRNSGMVTEVKRMLLLMNFEEVLISLTCYDGSIVTPLMWNLKGAALPYSVTVSGLRLT